MKTNYEFLVDMKREGRMKALFSVGVSTNIVDWMKIYAYHLAHPTLSQFQVSMHFNISKHMVWNAYRFMNQSIPE